MASFMATPPPGHVYRTLQRAAAWWEAEAPTGRLASVKPTGCPRVTAKLALRALTHRQHTHYPANDGITALTHRVATCKRRKDGDRLPAAESQLLSQEKQLSLKQREEGKKKDDDEEREVERHKR